MKVEYDIASMNSLRYLANKVDAFPNRIAAAREAGSIAAARIIERRLVEKYGNIGKAMYAQPSSGRGFSRVVIKVNNPTHSKKDHHYSAEWGALVKLYGRKAFRSKKQQYFELRPASVSAGYPAYIASFKVARTPKSPGMELDIRMMSAEILRNELRKAVRRYGFGVRGGAPRGMQDLPTPNTRARR